VSEEAASRTPTRRPCNEPALAQARWNLVVLCAAVVVLLATMLDGTGRREKPPWAVT
jgi:hypothetical protein